MPINGLLNSNDLEKMAALLEDNGYGASNITVVIGVRSHEILSRVNEDYYYRNNESGNPPAVDEVNVSIGNIKFKYVVEEGS